MDRSVNYFYTSCTRSDGWPSLSRFHADLEYRLRAQEGLWVGGVLGPQPGSPPVLESAITRVGVMIALYSPEYFKDRDCGLELAVFQRRLRRDEDRAERDVSECLIPLVWKPVPRLPNGAPAPEEWSIGAEWDDGYGYRRYVTSGLHGLMHSDGSAADEAYYSLIGQLAKRITEARRLGLAEITDAAELRDIQPAFGCTSHARQTTPARTPVRTGPGLGDLDHHAPLPTAPLESVAISYVGADQPWADWMEEILELAGHPEVSQVRWRTEDESLPETVRRAHEGAQRVVVVFSRSYFAAGSGDPLHWENAFVGPGKEWLIPVQIDAEPRPLLVRRGVRVTQLTGSDESQARLLCDLVREPDPQVPDQRGGDAR
ncbi:toll/interleukin-1 receptor domain-containing protein [Streptomyces sp. NPDC050564]|uniref:toll/interleukin-1 receptor domain-containing protein n=1 Tax=Streptomyces sp. NPDC050564 TaxID=3365631 RepID=UPI0037A2F29A